MGIHKTTQTSNQIFKFFQGPGQYLFVMWLCLITVMVNSCGKSNPSRPVDEETQCIQNGINVCNEDETVEFNVHLGNEQQTIRHFGASDAWSVEFIGSNWPQQKKEMIARLLFSKGTNSDGNPEGIGLSMWRFNIGNGSAQQQDNGFQAQAWFHTEECFLSEDGTWDWSRQEGSQWFIQKAKAYGVEHFTGWLSSPPYFMAKNGYTFQTSDVEGYNLLPEKYDDYANFLARVALHFEKEGITFDVISPANEPQWAWEYEVGSAVQGGTYATNRELADLARVIDSTFSAQNVSAGIMLPEAGAIDRLYKTNAADPQTSNQIYAFWDASSPDYIGNLPNISPFVAGHSYWSNPTVSATINHRTQLLNKLEQTDPSLEYWQTEYSLLGSDYQEGRAPSELSAIDYSLWLARVIHFDLTAANCTGWSFWTALSYSKYGDHKYRFGLLNWYPDVEDVTTSDGTIEVTKNLWAFGNFSRFVRPGMIRVEVENKTYPSAENAGKNVMISAYKDAAGEKLVLVLINYSSAKHRVKITNLAKDFAIEGDFESYTTSATKDLEKAMVSSDEIRIDGKSIVTLVASLQ